MATQVAAFEKKKSSLCRIQEKLDQSHIDFVFINLLLGQKEKLAFKINYTSDVSGGR